MTMVYFKTRVSILSSPTTDCREVVGDPGYCQHTVVRRRKIRLDIMELIYYTHCTMASPLCSSMSFKQF